MPKEGQVHSERWGLMEREPISQQSSYWSSYFHSSPSFLIIYPHSSQDNLLNFNRMLSFLCCKYFNGFPTGWRVTVTSTTPHEALQGSPALFEPHLQPPSSLSDLLNMRLPQPPMFVPLVFLSHLPYPPGVSLHTVSSDTSPNTPWKEIPLLLSITAFCSYP